MIRYFFVSILFLLLCSFINDQKEAYPPVKNESFSRGEVIHYKMNYGFLSIGKGTAQVHPHYFRLNNRDCFKVDILGKTVGMVDWVADLDDQWGAYVDTASLIPHQFYRRIREGRYRKDEWTNFDQVNNRIEVKTLDKKTGKLKEPKYYDAPAQVREMISGYLYLRNTNFSKIKVNDTIDVPGFFEDEFYNMKIVYRGKETIRTKIGKIRTIVLVPVMPDNKIFDGENSIKAWFSDDKNRIPVRIKAELFIGSGEMEIVSYSGLRNKLNLVKND
jgi:hypothetical protein